MLIYVDSIHFQQKRSMVAVRHLTRPYMYILESIMHPKSNPCRADWLPRQT